MTEEAAAPERVSTDTTVYEVMYVGGFTEEVVGLDAARMRIIRPETRAEGMPQDTIGTYRIKVS